MNTVRYKDTLLELGASPHTGPTSRVFRLADGRVLKRFVPEIGPQLLENEVGWLRELGDTGLVPAVLDVDWLESAFIMEEAGVPLCEANAPADWRRQIGQAVAVLGERGCYHNDLVNGNVLLGSDGQLRLIDFSYATGESVEGARRWLTAPRARYFLDRFAPAYLECVLGGVRPPAELHAAILWDFRAAEDLVELLEERFEVVAGVYYTGGFYRIARTTPRELAEQVYPGGGEPPVTPPRRPFYLFCLVDREPERCTIPSPFSGKPTECNAKMAALYEELGPGAIGYLRASLSGADAFTLLDALALVTDDPLRRLWQACHRG